MSAPAEEPAVAAGGEGSPRPGGTACAGSLHASRPAGELWVQSLPTSAALVQGGRRELAVSGVWGT